MKPSVTIYRSAQFSPITEADYDAMLLEGRLPDTLQLLRDDGTVLLAKGASGSFEVPSGVHLTASERKAIDFALANVADSAYARRRRLRPKRVPPGPSVVPGLDSAPLGARITPPPGSLLVSKLPYLFTRKTIAHVFTQALADMREEYFDALAAHKPWLARSIYFRWGLSVLSTVVLQWGVELAKRVHALWKLGGG